jgi:hypothetical protein
MLFNDIVKKYDFDDIKHLIENDKGKAKKLLNLLKKTKKDEIFSSMILTVEPTIGLLVVSEEDIVYYVSTLPLDICLNCYVNKKDLNFYGEKEILAMFIDDSIKSKEKINVSLNKLKELENILDDSNSDTIIDFTPDDKLEEAIKGANNLDEIVVLNYRAIHYLNEFISHKRNYIEMTLRIYEDQQSEIMNFKNINKKIKYKTPYKDIEIDTGEIVTLFKYIFDDNSFVYEEIQTTREYDFVVYFLALKDQNDKWIKETLWTDEEIDDYY